MIGPARMAPGLLAMLMIFLLPTSCASVRFMEDLADYDDAVEDLERQAARNPSDPQPLRDLGIIYLRTNNFAKANELLQLAFSRDPDDPKILFHLGLANETLGKQETARGLYERYPDVSRLSPYRRLMAERYANLTRKILHEAVRARVAEEERLIGEPVEPRIVAVYPLVYEGADAQYAPLGRGLAEMITIDLSQVDDLQLVERARLQTLLDELTLAQDEHFDPATAPRVGHLVGAGRLVGGVYNVLGQDDLQMGAAMWETERAGVADLGTRAGALRNLFEMEKELVFSAIGAMGIELTEEERRRIEFIPTQNLQAFLAFSRGLEREDAGAFDEAARFYEQAFQLDPNFSLAGARVDELLGQVFMSGSVSEALAVVYQHDPSPPAPGQPALDPMAIRLQNLNTSIGSYVVPGIDAREPAAESGSTVVTPPEPPNSLPDPPPPPQTGGGG